jgi:transcriptional regulator with XRE-family HTH domain
MASITPMPAPRTSRLNDIVQENVLAELARRRLTGRQAAPMMGLTRQTLSDKLRGRTRITADDIETFAEFFEMEPGDLVRLRGLEPRTRWLRTNVVDLALERARRRSGHRQGAVSA